jgi:hypothetical protein
MTMKVLPRLLVALLFLAVSTLTFAQATERNPTHENCGSSLNCTATYTDGTMVYVFQNAPEIVVFEANGTQLTVGGWLGTQTGTIKDQSYTDTSQSPNVTYEILSFSGASVSQAGVTQRNTGSGTVVYAYTRTCKTGVAGNCTIHLVMPIALKITF